MGKPARGTRPPIYRKPATKKERPAPAARQAAVEQPESEADFWSSGGRDDGFPGGQWAKPQWGYQKPRYGPWPSLIKRRRKDFSEDGIYGKTVDTRDSSPMAAAEAEAPAESAAAPAEAEPPAKAELPAQSAAARRASDIFATCHVATQRAA